MTTPEAPKAKQKGLHTYFLEIHAAFARHVYLLGVVDAGTLNVARLEDVALGSAFAVSPDGHFLTAYHCIEKDYSGIQKGTRQLGLSGRHGYGVKDESAVGASLLQVWPEADLALLKVPQKRSHYIELEASLAPPGAWVATIGYPLSKVMEDKKKVDVGKRIVTAIVSASFSEKGVKWLEVDKHLSNGHSGGPIFNLAGRATAVATEHARVWHVVNERVKEPEGEWTTKQRLLELPTAFAQATLIMTIADDLKKHGIPIFTPP